MIALSIRYYESEFEIGKDKKLDLADASPTKDKWLFIRAVRSTLLKRLNHRLQLFGRAGRAEVVLVASGVVF